MLELFWGDFLLLMCSRKLRNKTFIYFGFMELRRSEPFQHLTKQDNQKKTNLSLWDKHWESCSNQEILNLHFHKNTINVWSYQDKEIYLLLRRSKSLLCPPLTKLLHTCCRKWCHMSSDRKEHGLKYPSTGSLHVFSRLRIQIVPTVIKTHSSTGTLHQM